MRLFTKTDWQLLRHPWEFGYRVTHQFGRNQGLMLAGAFAYYALLSLVPLTILAVTVLSHWVDQAYLLGILAHYLEWLVPSQSQAVLADVSSFIENRASIGLILFLTMLFFSSLAFSILQKALAVIFAHRTQREKRHFLVAALLPYSLVLLMGCALLAITVGSIVIHSLTQETIPLFGYDWSLHGISGLAFYGLGLAVEITVLSALYAALPVGRTRFRHALIGAISVTVIWDGCRRVLAWYFTTLSQAGIVYGSLTTAIVVLFSIEIAATLLLLGAQVIAEYEQLETRLEN